MTDCVVWYVVSRRLVSVFADSCECAAGKKGRSEGGEKTRSILVRRKEVRMVWTSCSCVII